MARYTGSLLCADGTRLYFVFCGTTGICRPRLFNSAEEAYDNWGTDQSEAYKKAQELENDKNLVFEEVDLVPYYTTGICLDHEIPSKISREHMLIVGHLSMDSFLAEQDRDRFSGFRGFR